MIIRALRTFYLILFLLFSGGGLLAENLIVSQTWNYISDRVMGGVSLGKAQFEDTTSGRALRLFGEVSTANNGGFIQVRTQYSKSSPDNALGLELTVRGNSEVYFIHIRTNGTKLPWHYYTQSFKTSPEWTAVKLPFDKFERSSRLMGKFLDQHNINTIGLVAYGKDHYADLYIQDLRFYYE